MNSKLYQKYRSTIERVDQLILSKTKSNRKIINTSINDLVESGGKRLRPVLLLLAAQYGDYDKEKMLPIAASMEMLHMATLVHDDIIDDAKLRRGEITTQQKFGKNIAVFVGDYLLSKTFDLFAVHLSRESLIRLNKIVRLICEGEIDQYQSKFDVTTTVSGYLKRIRRKTAILFGLSAYLGAYESGVRGKNLYRLYKMGIELGMAFQIQDDILDFTGDEEKTGKKLGQDLLSGIYTLPVIYLLKNAEYGEEARLILSRKQLDKEELQKVLQLVDKIGGVEKSRRLAERFIKRTSLLIDNLPMNPAKKAIVKIIERQLSREF